MQRWCKFPTVSSGALKKGDSGGLGAKCFWSHHVCIFIVVVNPISTCNFVKHLKKCYISWEIFSYWSEEYWYHHLGRQIIKLGPELNQTYQRPGFSACLPEKKTALWYNAYTRTMNQSTFIEIFKAQTWYLSKILHSQIFELKVLHHKSA